MSGRIIFFPMKFCPGIDSIFHLRELQDKLNDFHLDIASECLKFNLSAYQKVIRKQSMVNTLRDSWKLLDGGKKDSKAA